MITSRRAVFVALVASFAFVGCSSFSATVTNSTRQTSTNSKNELQVPPHVYKIGDEIRLGSNVVIVNGIQRLSVGNEIEQPVIGSEYIVVKVTIQNNGDQKTTYHPLDFKLKNSKGDIRDETFSTVDQATQLISGTLEPKSMVTGTLAFIEPKNEKLQLLYKPSGGSDTAIIVNLN